MCRRFPPRLPGLCSVAYTRLLRRRLLAAKGPSGDRFPYATVLRAVLRHPAPVRRVALSQALTYDRTATASPFRERSGLHLLSIGRGSRCPAGAPKRRISI